MASGGESDITIPKTLHDETESDKTKLTSLTKEGYSNKFVNEIVELDIECTFCVMVVRDARQISACGHTFCATCWVDWRSSHKGDAEIRCPVDNEVVDVSEVFKDRKQDRLIGGLKVYCDNVDSGCVVTPELRYLQAHLEKCEYSMVPCSQGCGEEVMSWCLTNHIRTQCSRRQVDCLDCGECMQALDLESHADSCPMKPLECQYCEVSMNKAQLRHHHQTDCPTFPTFCNFALFGCKEMVERHALQTHHQTRADQHLTLLTSAVHQICCNTTGKPPQYTDTPLQYELPAPLWGCVSENGESDVANIAWSELPGCDVSTARNQDSRLSLHDQFMRLEEKNKKLEIDNNNLLKEIGDIKRREEENKVLLSGYQKNMEKMKISIEEMKRSGNKQIEESRKHNGNINKNIDALNKNVAENGRLLKGKALTLIKTNMDDMKRSLGDAMIQIENLSDGKDGIVQLMEDAQKCMDRAQRNSDDNRAMRDTYNMKVNELWNTIDELKKADEALNVTMDRTTKLVDKMDANSKVPKVVEGINFARRHWWTVRLVKDINKTGHKFYTIDGYRMEFAAIWRKVDNVFMFDVGVQLIKGNMDDYLAWPWNGREALTVTEDATQRVLAVAGDVNERGSIQPGCARDGINAFLLYIGLDASMEDKVITLTMK